MADPGAVLGVVLAGGENRRYGSHKALEEVGGVRIAERVIAALGAVAAGPVVVANEMELYEPLGLPVRPDVRPGLGALGGVLTAVTWARDLGAEAALVVACDMPFVPAALLRDLVDLAEPGAAAAPASPGRRGLEPLCAAYGTTCASAIEHALERGDRSVISFFDEVDVHILPPARVAMHGDPDHLFLNVNRPEDRERAERECNFQDVKSAHPSVEADG